MRSALRTSMAWLHTWTGVVTGALLFVVFWMGSLSVFDQEIDRWMMPATRLPAAAAPLSLDRTIRPIAESLVSGAPAWTVTLPGERMPAYQIGYTDAAGQYVRRHVDPAAGSLLPAAGTHGASGFIFPFHYQLHIGWKDVGYWLVGLAGMATLVLLTSGVIIHRKLVQDFFRFRPDKQLPRTSLDLHNLSGVLFLPFHVAMALSGLFIFWTIYFPWPVTLPFGGDKAALMAAAYGNVTRPSSGQLAPQASLDAIVRDAQARWAARHGAPLEADVVRVSGARDAAGVVTVRSLFPQDGVAMDRGVAVYDGGTGRLLHDHEAGPVRKVHAFLSGMHFIQFRHWTLRCLYFLGGLAGCVMIATGFLFWLETRRARHEKLGLPGVALVQGLVTGVVTGTILATCAFLLSNRLLPAQAAWGGVARAELEMWAFFLVWLAGFVHAWLRPRQAWREQALGTAVLALAAVAANAIGTRGGLLAPGLPGNGAVLGVDCMLIAVAGVAWLAARGIKRRKQGRADRRVPVAGQPLSAQGGRHE